MLRSAKSDIDAMSSRRRSTRHLATPATRRPAALVGVPSAPVALSLNASFMNLGFSLGGALGGFALFHVGPRNLGFVGATCELAALTLLLVNQGRDARPQSDGGLSTARERDVEHGSGVRSPYV